MASRKTPIIETHAASGAPPNALRMWTDGVRIYVELPGSDGKPPYITTELYSEAGLAKALRILGVHRVDYDYLGTVPDGYTGRGTPSHSSAIAEKVLRQRGLIK
jgi:hypothetical protein